MLFSYLGSAGVAKNHSSRVLHGTTGHRDYVTPAERLHHNNVTRRRADVEGKRKSFRESNDIGLGHHVFPREDEEVGVGAPVVGGVVVVFPPKAEAKAEAEIGFTVQNFGCKDHCCLKEGFLGVKMRFQCDEEGGGEGGERRTQGRRENI